MKQTFPSIYLIAAASLMVLGPGLLFGQASQGPSFGAPPGTITAVYDQYLGNNITGDIIVSGRNVEFGIGFSAGGSASFSQRRLTGPGGAALEYQLLDPEADDRVLTDLDGPAGQRHLIYHEFRGNQEEPFPLVVRIPQGQFPPAGTYTDTVQTRLYRGIPATTPSLEEEPLHIVVTVPPVVRLSVVGRGQPFDPLSDVAHLDFGELQQGRSEEVDLVVVTDINYRLSVTSPNSGFLVLEGATPGSAVTRGEAIPYTMRVNGLIRDLSSGHAEIGSGSPTSIAGDRYELYFEIGDVRDATSGEYTENLTVTVTAQ
ncbi:Spore Coat Protein U domain-containing protein [Alkalispirochaeta americana]|uniref:Spore Coat Protein U domain-containing protein n=1 Tax=Alkalispirochaeta americana TaxID=159291 RepID=A0A1N6WND4_9SPIO|nr:spore coat protein U domain-containing protein [Alkalispirochaeta americana]SIQ91540.1 Spore Coat Protein U domain-containing protein [Alkalispirochaeta americana]